MDDNLDQYLEKVFEQIDDVNLRKFIPYMKEIYEYNLAGGKKNRGNFVIKTYEILSESRPQKNLANLAAWLVEIFHTVFIMLDDIMDDSEIRRGKDCWYKKVGMIAINDALLLQQHVYELIRLNFKPKPYYIRMLEFFNKIFLLRVYGKMIDGKTNMKECTLDDYTMSKLTSMYKLKYSFEQFVFPVKTGLMVKEQGIDEDLDKLDNIPLYSILLKIGHLKNMTDDYLSCYGETDIVKRKLCDIEMGKLCWPIVMALQKCSDAQRKVLDDNYGKAGEDNVKMVKQVYAELKLGNIFRKESDFLQTEIELDIKGKLDNIEHVQMVNDIFAKVLNREQK